MFSNVKGFYFFKMRLHGLGPCRSWGNGGEAYKCSFALSFFFDFFLVFPSPSFVCSLVLRGPFLSRLSQWCSAFVVARTRCRDEEHGLFPAAFPPPPLSLHPPQESVELENDEEEEEEEGEAVAHFSLLHGSTGFLQKKLPPPRVLVALGSESLVEKLLLPPFSFNPSSVLFLHSSLEILADAKAKCEDLRCLHFETEEEEKEEKEEDSSVMEFPDSCCPFQLIFLNNFSSLRLWPRQFLPRIFGLCSAGAMVFISCRSGKSQHDTPPKSLADFEGLLSDFPLEVTAIKEESGLFLAALKVKDQLNKGANGTASDLVPNKGQGHFPLHVKGVVEHGFGRGSKQLGFPTANIAVEKLPRDVAELQNGVYYGWAQVIGINSKPEVHEMVMNVGLRPTFGDADSITLEVHILHNYGVDFHGKELRLVILGFIRGELKLKSLDELIRRIQMDVEITKEALSKEDMQGFKSDKLFL